MSIIKWSVQIFLKQSISEIKNTSVVPEDKVHRNSLTSLKSHTISLILSEKIKLTGGIQPSVFLKTMYLSKFLITLFNCKRCRCFSNHLTGCYKRHCATTHAKPFIYLFICFHRFPAQYLTYHLQMRFCSPWLILKHFKVSVWVMNRRDPLSQTPRHLSSTPSRFNELSFLKQDFHQRLVVLTLNKKISKGHSHRHVNYFLKPAYVKQYTDQNINHQMEVIQKNQLSFLQHEDH